ncbi:hypothetical protein Tco_0434608 [Tanacetum coccineum]
MVPEQVKTMKIQAGVQVSRQGELKRHLQLWKCFGRLYFIVIVLDRNIDGKFSSNRLENLLVQGKQDRDFLTNEALQPVLKLLSGPEGEEWRTLVIKEAIRVTEENTIGIMVDTYNSIPAPLKTFIPNGNGIGTPLTNAEIVPD